MVCAALLWDRLITPERAAMPFYAEFSDVKSPIALMSTVAPDASPQPQNTIVVQQKGAPTLLSLCRQGPYRASCIIRTLQGR